MVLTKEQTKSNLFFFSVCATAIGLLVCGTAFLFRIYAHDNTHLMGMMQCFTTGRHKVIIKLR